LSSRRHRGSLLRLAQAAIPLRQTSEWSPSRSSFLFFYEFFLKETKISSRPKGAMKPGRARALAAAFAAVLLATPLGSSADIGDSGFDSLQKHPNMPPDYVPDVFATAETNHLQYYQVRTW